jgi:hypothetical protein
MSEAVANRPCSGETAERARSRFILDQMFA